MTSAASKTVLVTGAAGFIGSHLADRLLRSGHHVVGVDNLSRGTRRNLQQALASPRFTLLQTDISDLNALRRAVAPYKLDTVWHMAANSDIEGGVFDPGIDLRDTFMTTFNLLKVMRESAIPNVVFASSSAVYGMHDGLLEEDSGPLFPISNYGAMKLASEAIISAALESFLERAWILRFPNVVGSRATHGIIFDLFNKLARFPAQLDVLGDGNQRKPYLHVSELLDAMLFIEQRAGERLNCFIVGPPDDGVTVKEIAASVLEQAESPAPLRFTGGTKGWVGDVPRFQYSISKLDRLGWRPAFSSYQAIRRAVVEIHSELQVQA